MIYRLCLLSILASSVAFGQTYADWVRHRDSLRSDPGVVGFWTFEDMSPENPVTANLRGGGHELRFQLAPKEGHEAQALQTVPGRWPEKTAVRLDMGRLEGEPFEVEARSFTATCWVRRHGPGVHRGNNESPNGTILSTGIGYWDGWRIATWYPGQRLSFEIGRPQPSSSVGVSGDGCPDGVWHHIAATWDGKEMRLYVNGLVVARGEYSGDYTPPPNDRRLRVGFAGSGIGSAVLDVDEVAIWNRALFPGEVLREAYPEPGLGEETLEGLALAEKAYQERDLAGAARGYEEMLRSRLSPALQSMVRLRLAQIAVQTAQPAKALRECLAINALAGATEANRATALTLLLRLAREGGGALVPLEVYDVVLKLPGLSPADQMNAHLQRGRLLSQQGQSAAATAAYEAALKVEGMTAQERVNTLLSIAHSARAGKDYEGAGKVYRQVAEAQEAPVVARVAARFGMAECAVAQKRVEAAEAAYREVVDEEGVPAHLRGEARERLAALTGKEGRDMMHRTLPAQPKPGVTFYVAPTGSDQNPGTLERPFGTLARAREAVRAARKAGRLPAGGAKVYLRGGEYPVRETFELAAEDGGTAEAPVVYRAYREEKPVLRGTVRLRDMRPCRDAAVLARVPEGSRNQVLEIDLKANGITDYGEMRPHGYGMGSVPQTEVFWNGTPLKPARWPNGGWMRVGAMVSGGQNGQEPAVFEVEDERLARWAGAKDVMLDGYWQWDWAETVVGPVVVDAEKKQITIPRPPDFGVRSGQRFFALNLLEEVDEPGEYYLDRERGMLYLHALPEAAKVVEITTRRGTSPRPTGGAAAPAGTGDTQSFVTLTDCSFVTLQGLTFDGGRGNGVEVRGGEHCLLVGCTVSRVGMEGVVVEGGREHGLFGCDITQTGRGGVVMSGGDRKTLTPANHFIENCHIHDFSRIDRSYTPAVLMNGVGNRIVHNLIHESPHHALRIEGNDHVIAFNEVHSVVLEGDDQGGVDMWGNATYRGNQYLYNYWHHIGSGVACGQSGIRLDDAISGTLLYGNVFHKCSESQFGAVQIHGGKENVIDNNVFVDCKYAVSFSGWGQGGWRDFLDSHRKQMYEEVDIARQPYSTRYPDLARIAEGEGINTVSRNLVVNCGGFLTRDRGIQEVVDNVIVAEDPGFVDAAKGDLHLRSGAPVLSESSFRAIPFGEIGMYRDKARASWPVANEVSPNYRPEKRGE